MKRQEVIAGRFESGHVRDAAETALITGASSGIGAALARRFTRGRRRLVLVALAGSLVRWRAGLPEPPSTVRTNVRRPHDAPGLAPR